MALSGFGARDGDDLAVQLPLFVVPSLKDRINDDNWTLWTTPAQEENAEADGSSTALVVAEPPKPVAVPLYLTPIPDGVRTYGTVKRQKDSWLIEAEPQVAELAKRLFHGSKAMGRGKARIPANKRTIGDLNWLMQRYPLQVLDEDKQDFQNQLNEAINMIVKREDYLRAAGSGKQIEGIKVEMRPFQKEGVAFMLHNRRALLADEMGLGKSLQAIAFLIGSRGFPALIVVPPHLVYQWPNEIRKFLGDEATSHVVKGAKPYHLPNVDFTIIHYLLLDAWKDALDAAGFKHIVFDEIQELRHHNTNKYSAASSIASKAESICGLSGTPIHNSGAEIWSVMNIIEFHCLGNRDSFCKEYCDATQNDVVLDPEVLGAHLREEGLMLRRTKAQVLPQLPPKQQVVEVIEMDAGVYGKHIGNAIKAAHKALTATNAFERARLEMEAVQAERQATGIAKAPYVAEFVNFLLEAGEPVLLFAHHHKVFDIYLDALKKFNPIEITGRTKGEEKINLVNSFQAGNTNLALIGLRAASGLNMQRARVVVFGELDWSPAIHAQAEDRCHRIGQVDSVLAYYLVAKDSSDDDMLGHLGLKVAQFRGLMGDKGSTDEDTVLATESAKSHINALLERLRSKTIRQSPDDDQQPLYQQPDLFDGGNETEG